MESASRRVVGHGDQRSRGASRFHGTSTDRAALLANDVDDASDPPSRRNPAARAYPSNALSASRDQTITGSPRTSIVVASRGDAARLQACLAAVREQGARWGAEVIVAWSGEAAAMSALAARYPYARFVGCAAGATAAELRAAGMRVAGGDIVALTDDASAPASDWLQQLVSAYQRSAT